MELELPLVFFTVFTQMAVGGFIFLWWLGNRVPVLSLTGTGGSGAGHRPERPLLVLAGVQGLALVLSLFHLGQPLAAYRALAHLDTSWLSREVVLTSMFFASLAACALLEGYRRLTAAPWLTALLGVLAVVASGLVYMLPARPAWNNLWPVFSFGMTAWVGGMALGAFLLQGMPVTAGYQPAGGTVPVAAASEGGPGTLLTAPAGGEAGPLPNAIRQLLLAGLAVSLGATILYLSTLTGGGPEARATLGNIISAPLFWLRVVLGWLLPGLLLLRPRTDNRSKAVLLLVLVVLGELLGRAVFYGTVVPMGINQGF
ncbi:MAG: dimethyl sulfoxide reductase anchor subunit [Thermoanaerobacteraceae bacterium]|nr:dimethyl sulfoxide reductase anchor subunit [Thermoanaerobacteraceae bacterium]